MTPEAKYEKSVVRSEVGCWGWSSTLKNGYGLIRVGHSDWVYAHRLSMQMALGGPIPDGLHICHTCDNKVCTNPAHLFLGTNADNAADARAKGLRIKPTCRRGHVKTADNLYIRYDKRGYVERHCRACMRLRWSKSA